MHWTWDETKAAINLRKHGISFELAALALDSDPGMLSAPDPHPDADRWDTLAVIGTAMLYVVHTWPDHDQGSGRIISARRASSKEKVRYENG